MKKLLITSCICSAIFLLYGFDHALAGARFAVVLKVASIGLLAVMAAAATPRRKLLILALVSSAVGDLLLDIRRLGPLGPAQLFLCGLISFLIAHLFYVALFAQNRRQEMSASRKAACGVVVVVAAVSLRALWPGLAEMRIPVVAYSIVLSAMAITAQWSRFSPLVAIGALSFVASDTMLAMSIFGHPFRGSWALVWITYYVAQAMIAVGVLRSADAYSPTKEAFVSIGT